MKENVSLYMTNDVLDEGLQKNYHLPQRRGLLPVWIKIFCWIFMLGGALTPFMFLCALFHLNVHLEIFGFESNDAFSGEGILIILIFLFKGIVAYGLWFEKKWGVQAAIFDGLAGIGLCLIQMFMSPYQSEPHFTFRFELLLFIPYLLRLKKIRHDWENEY